MIKFNSTCFAAGHDLRTAAKTLREWSAPKTIVCCLRTGVESNNLEDGIVIRYGVLSLRAPSNDAHESPVTRLRDPLRDIRERRRHPSRESSVAPRLAKRPSG